MCMLLWYVYVISKVQSVSVVKRETPNQRHYKITMIQSDNSEYSEYLYIEGN